LKVLSDRNRLVALAFFVCIVLALEIAVASAQAPRDLFFKAEGCYRDLRQSPKQMKYRENWLRCIEAFEAVYKADPGGPWAPAGLYKSGELYRDMYRISFRTADLKEALDIFARVVKRFPQSSYRQRAQTRISSITRTYFKGEPPPKNDEAAKAFAAAEACRDKLLGNPTGMKYRENWLGCIRQFDAAYRQDPTGPRAPAALFQVARLYGELYRHSFRDADEQESIALFNRLVGEFPNSDYAAQADRRLGRAPAREENSDSGPQQLPEDVVATLIEASKAGVHADNGSQDAAGRALITDLRYWSNPNYTRIVIDANGETAYTHRLLNEDPSIQKPQRLYVDLENSKLAKDTSKVVPINDNLLSSVRAGQYTLDTVRVVVDIKSLNAYKIFSLKNPFRIVIDIRGGDSPAAAAANRPAPAGANDQKLPTGSLAKQLALGVHKIVIDPGHGGRDFGAPGYLKGVHEKYVVLNIGKKLADKIRKELGCEVVLTRTRDKFLTLEERTAIANTENADLFVSIHTNSARDRRAYGIETYILNLATDDESIRVAAMENATSTKNISDLQTILNDLMQNAKINESSRLAAHVQEAVYRHMKSKYNMVKNKGVKQAPFYVLLGAQMPAILVETSFISNSRECKRLVNPKYQDQLTDAIVKGIREYIKETNPTAFGPSSAARYRG